MLREHESPRRPQGRRGLSFCVSGVFLSGWTSCSRTSAPSEGPAKRQCRRSCLEEEPESRRPRVPSSCQSVRSPARPTRCVLLCAEFSAHQSDTPDRGGRSPTGRAARLLDGFGLTGMCITALPDAQSTTAEGECRRSLSETGAGDAFSGSVMLCRSGGLREDQTKKH